jgi:membrane protease YdiL (CAAX protease family)
LEREYILWRARILGTSDVSLSCAVRVSAGNYLPCILFERYRRLVGNSVLLVVLSAVAFSFAHIIFRNPIAVSFTLTGGLLFDWRYAETGSLLTSSFEHALYGCWMFTIGLGEYFYKGAR